MNVEKKMWSIQTTAGREMSNNKRIDVIITDLGDSFQVQSGSQKIVCNKLDKNYPRVKPLEANLPAYGYVKIPNEIANELYNI